MEKLSKMEQLFNLFLDNPSIKNADAAEELGVPEPSIRTMKYRMKKNGYICTDIDGGVVPLKPYKEDVEKPVSLKAQIYREMLDIYMQDFRDAETFRDRLEVGQEIRLILKNV